MPPSFRLPCVLASLALLAALGLLNRSSVYDSVELPVPSDQVVLAESGYKATPAGGPAEVPKQGYEPPPDWAGATVLDHRTSEGGSWFERAWLLVDPESGLPVRVRERGLIDADSGERVRRYRIESIADRVLVKAAPSIERADLERMLATVGARFERDLALSGWAVARFERYDLDTVDWVVRTLERFPDIVADVETDNLSRSTLLPNDPRAADQWAIDNTGQEGGVILKDMAIAAGWDSITNAPSVVVAIIDSGVMRAHEDLGANVWMNPGENGVDENSSLRAFNGIDDDGNGYVDDSWGYDFESDDANPTDSDDHGTPIAGIVGALGDNSAGISGVAWSASVMAVRAGGQFFSSSGIVESLEYARKNGARVINCSFGSAIDNQAEEDAYRAARDSGVIVVCSAGNEGLNTDYFPHYPSGYELDNILSVGSFSPDGSLSDFSNYGELTVDLAAPGDRILSLSSENAAAYEKFTGTSFSAPHVSGLAALLMARFPNEGYRAIINRILGSVDRDEELIGLVRAGGRANLRKALDLASVGELPRVVEPLADLSPVVGESFTLSVRAESDSALSYRWRKDGIEIEGANEPTLLVEAASSADFGHYRVFIANAFGEVTSSSYVDGLPDPSSDVVYVDAKALGSNDGSSWENAFVRLETALAASPPESSLWIADGIYTPDTDDRDDSFLLDKELGLYGGFRGGETLFIQRDVVNHRAVLSGEIGSSASREDNLYHVARVTATDRVVIDGLRIERGYAKNAQDPFSNDNDGGGILNLADTLIMKNTTVRDNYADFYGGGVESPFYTTLQLSECVFEANESDYRGGGLSADGFADLTGCHFIRNRAAFSGGGIASSGGLSYFKGCSLLGNVAGLYGAGFWLQGGLSAVDNTLFVGNRSELSGGALLGDSGATVAAVNCEFVENRALATGSVARGFEEATVVVLNSTIWGNEDEDGEPMSGREGSFVLASVSIADREIARSAGSIVGASPRFRRYPHPGADGVWGSGDDDYGDLSKRMGSPVVDAGENLEEASHFDFSGNARFIDGDGNGVATVDIGAYETSSFAVWLTSHFGKEAQVDTLGFADSDEDGLSNAVEFIGDTDPLRADLERPSASAYLTGDSKLIFEYRQAASRTGVIASLERSENGIEWVPMTPVRDYGEESFAIGGGLERLCLSLDRKSIGGQPLFLRLALRLEVEME